MPQSENPDDQPYVVLVNREEQYSLLPLGWPIPGDWRPEGTQGSRSQCLARIDEVWSDLRPLSVR